jgi:hypothetical protein
METTESPHTLDAKVVVDVSNNEQSTSISSNDTLTPQTDITIESVTVENVEITKPVKVLGNKRRKVVESSILSATERRRTRSGSIRGQNLKTSRPVVPKYASVEQLKDVTKSEHKKKMQETYERHDSKVRELFHLTKFVSLVDYDAKIAKQDESEVFHEVLCYFISDGLTSSSSSNRMTSGKRLQMQRQEDE